MGNYSSKSRLDNKKILSDKKEKNFDYINKRSTKNKDNNNKIREKKADEKDKDLTKDKRKHFLNRLTFVNKRETFVENNLIPRNSIGACSYYDENNNLFDYNPDFSTNYENFKFSNSFVDDYNMNNEYLNNYINSHNKLDESNLNDSVNIINAGNGKSKTNKGTIRNSISEDNLFLINGAKNQNKGNLHFESFDYANYNKNDASSRNSIIKNKFIIDSRRNSDLKNTFLSKESKTSFGYNLNSKRQSTCNYDMNDIDGNYNFEKFDNSFIEKNKNKNYRKNRKNIISNLINDSIALKKNIEKEDKYVDQISLNEHIAYNSIIEKEITHEDDKMFEEKIHSKQRKLEENNYNYAETKNSLFLDLKNQEFFFDNQCSNNFANNSYSDIKSTSDTKVFEIAKPRNKTPDRELRNNESDISIINSNKSETKTIDFLSKSYEVFDINNKKDEENYPSEISIENISNKDNSSFEKNNKKSISFDYEKVEKINSLSKSPIENLKNYNKNISSVTNVYKKGIDYPVNLDSIEKNKERKSYSNIDLAHINNDRVILYDIKSNLLDNNQLLNNTIANHNKQINEESSYSPRFRKSIISNIHAFNKSSDNIYNNLSKNISKLEVNNLNNSYFYTKTYQSNSDTKSVLYSETNSTSFRMTVGNNFSKSKTLNDSQSEYKLNYYREKHSDNLRKNYIAKLIYKQIWQPSKKEKNHNSLILFDWDDTLLCTSFFTPNGIYREDLKLSDKDLEKLAKLEFSVLRLLTLAVEKGDVYIITNAAPGWVEFSAEKYYPSLKNIIKKVSIVSARGEFEKEFPGDSRMWKIQAFLNMQKNFDSNLITNIICLGDSFIEMEAAQILAGKFSKAFIKSVKFRESPKPEELNKQLTLVADQFLSIYSSIKNLTIRVEKKLRK